MRTQDTYPVANAMEKRRAESVKTLALLGTLGAWIAFVIAAAGYLFLFIRPDQQIDLYYGVVLGAGAIMAICLTIANLLAQRGKIDWAIWLSIFSAEIVFITISFAMANLGIILALVLVIGLGNLILQALSSRAAISAISTVMIAAIAVIAIDIFAVNPLRIIPPDWLVGTVIISSGIITLVFGIQLLAQYLFRNLRTQIIVAFVLISVIPLWTITIFQLAATNISLQANAYESISNSTEDVATDFDNVLTRIKNNNLSDAEFPIFKTFIQSGSEELHKDVIEYFKVIQKRGEDVLGYSLIDPSGKILADSRPAPAESNIGSAPDFQAAVKTQKSTLSDVSFDPSIKKYVFYISSPVLNNNKLIGILRVEIDTAFLQDEFVEEAQVQGKDVHVILIDQDGVILANSTSQESIFKLISPISSDRLPAIQKKYALPSPVIEDLHLLELQKNLASNVPSFKATMSLGDTEADFIAYHGITNNPSWRVVVGRPVSWFTESANTPTRVTILIATILMITALAIAMMSSNLLTSPLHYLINKSQLLRKGDLGSVGITLERQDEIGELSRILNSTILELRDISETFENRVTERTAELESREQTSLQNAKLLRSVVGITHAISSIQNSNELLHEITQQISTAFGFYHVGIFLTEQSGQYAVLQASNSIPGQKMLQKGYRVKISQADKIGFAISSGLVYSAKKEDQEATTPKNPDLINTNSQVIVPLRIGENVIGALDLQTDQRIDFNTSSIDAFNLIAEQISIAIQNVKALEETRSALTEAQAFYKQSASTSWRNVLQQGTRGYRYLNGNVEPVKESAEKPSKQDQDTQSSPESLVIPINIRGKSLGTLNIQQTGRNHSWSGLEIRVYQSIVDRISFALENARLYQDAQRRAAKERVISEIATRVSSSVNMDNILQTAVEELGRVLPGSEIVIQFEHEEDETGSEFSGQE